MEQIEVMSWKTLDAIKQAAQVFDTMGDLDTNEQMAIFCSIEEDFFELYYSELESNYIRRFEDEEEMYKYLDIRKNEFGEDEYEMDYYDEEDEDFDEDEGYSDFSIKDEDEDEF